MPDWSASIARKLWFRLMKSRSPRGVSWTNGLPNTRRFMPWSIGMTGSEKTPVIMTALLKPPRARPSRCWARPDKNSRPACWNPIRRWFGKIRMSASKSGPRMSCLNLHLELLPFFQGRSEAGQQLRNQFEIFQADQLDGGIHVTIRQTDQGAGNSAAGPENRVGVRPARGRHRLMLQRNLPGSGDRFEAGNHVRMVTAAVSERRAAANLHFTVLLFVHIGIIGGMRLIHDQRDIRLQGIGDLPGPQEADLFLHIGDRADLGL